MPPFVACPSCAKDCFGVLRVGPDFALRQCRDCLHRESFPLPKVHKAIIYLDQFVVSNLMLVRSKAKRVQPFYHTLYDKLVRLSDLQAIVCPHSEAHLLESAVATDPEALREGYEMFAHSVRFGGFESIRNRQVVDRLKSWLNRDSSRPCDVTPQDVLRGDHPDVWVDRTRILVELPPAPALILKLRDWRGESHRRLVDVFENTWKQEPYRSWEHWRDREARGWGPLLIPIYEREIGRWDDLLNGRRQPDGPQDMEPHPFVSLVHGMVNEIEAAGCPRREGLRMAFMFLCSTSLAQAPFRQIAGSLYACLARKAASQVKHPTQGFHNDVDVMSCLSPYCDAMFMDNEIANYWREIQGTPLRRLPFQTRVFSLSTGDDFLLYLDDLDRAVPEVQRRLAAELYGQ